MEWSKAQCNQNNLDVSPQNLREQLKGIFSEIPFDQLTMDQLTQHVAAYKAFFTAEELEQLFINKSLPKKPNPFDLQLLQTELPNIPRNIVLECERKVSRPFTNDRWH